MIDKLLCRYEGWVVRNGPLVQQLEGTLQGVRLLLPGRLDPAQDMLVMTVSECLHSALLLIRAYHDLLYSRRFPHALEQSSNDLVNSFSYDQKDKGDGSRRLRTALWLLNVLTTTQVPLELLAERLCPLSTSSLHYHEYPERFCLLVECVKSGLRLYIWIKANYRRVLRDYLPRGVRRPLHPISPEEALLSPNDDVPMRPLSLMYQSLKHCAPSIGAFVDWQLHTAHQHAIDGINDDDEDSGAKALDWHELVHILRPIVTALAHWQQRRAADAADQRTQWLWWLGNVAVEMVALAPDLRHYWRQFSPLPIRCTDNEREEEERLRRVVSLLLNLVREPMYTNGGMIGPRRVLDHVVDGLTAWTLLRPVGATVRAWQRLLEHSYFVKSSS